MRRPENVDIWDGIELERDETLTEEEKAANIERILAEAKEAADRRKKEREKSA